MHRIDLNTLSQFAVVARQLNFRRAAAEPAISPSTLSERFRDLEDQMGVRLLNRTTRGASLTEEGQRLLELTRDAITVLDETLAQDVVAVKLGADQRMIVAATPDYLSRHPAPTHPDELADHECIGTVFARGNVLPWSLEKDGDSIDFTPRDRLLVNSIEIAIMAAHDR